MKLIFSLLTFVVSTVWPEFVYYIQQNTENMYYFFVYVVSIYNMLNVIWYVINCVNSIPGLFNNFTIIQNMHYRVFNITIGANFRYARQPFT